MGRSSSRAAVQGRHAQWSSYPSASGLLLNLVTLLLALTTLAGGQLLPADFQVLQDLAKSLSDLPGTDFLKTWDFDLDPCNFFQGVSCANVGTGILRVVILNLGSASGGLRGAIPTSIGNLQGLTQFSIAPGQVSGVIPDGVGSLSSLQFLGLSNNQLQGSIPVSLQNCNSLAYLDLSYNHHSGSIPQGLANLGSLVSVNLQHNNLGGSIPSFTSSRLTHLDLSKNSFTGNLPGSLPTSLRYLSVLKNDVGGRIDVVGSLSNLEYLDLGRNLFTGSVPQQVFSFPLNYLLLHRNLLSGTISPSGPVRISEVDLSNNRFTGALSPYLSTVESLYVNNNLFTGGVPADYVASLLAGAMKNLYLQHNYLTSFSVSANFPSVSSLCAQYNCFSPLAAPLALPKQVSK